VERWYRFAATTRKEAVNGDGDVSSHSVITAMVVAAETSPI
jgi:hypothetical protein